MQPTTTPSASRLLGVCFFAGGWSADAVAVVVKDEMTERRFPPPWSVDEADPEMDRRCFIVRDADGLALAYVFFEGLRVGPGSCKPTEGLPNPGQTGRDTRGDPSVVSPSVWILTFLNGVKIGAI
jgi:hypothetical protein